MKPLILAGTPALSDFRVVALTKELSAAGPGIHSVSASLVYALEIDGELSDGDMSRSTALLGATGILDCGTTIEDPAGGFFVTPRKGTISPWSSKATDIFRNCGLSAVSRVERGTLYRLHSKTGPITFEASRPFMSVLHDRMTEGVYTDLSDIFEHRPPQPFVSVDVLGQGKAALEKANVSMGLALSAGEIDYLYACYTAVERNPTDVELVMFGQVNSEHCRHKIFNADWTIDGRRQDASLFAMIRNTHACHPGGVLAAYADNSAVIEGFGAQWFEAPAARPAVYSYVPGMIDIVMKVETHNHPTAISPYAGAATGIGGEIRDEAATGIGGRSKAGLSGFMVSNLRIPGFMMPWELDYAKHPRRLATPLEIMLEGPIGGAGFGNEFGRPQLCGFFKTYEERHNNRYRGYHKPIMIAGGMGNIKRTHSQKHNIPTGAAIIQIGGPAMRIGLGGGAASSMDTGSNEEALDFDSVQRDNPEMQRRCQQVIDSCIAMNENNLIASIHDLGAGGLSNGCPELVSETGGRFWLRKVHNEETSMSPMEIWCCEAQERYVLAVARDALDGFMALCERERCPVAVVGEATGDGHLSLYDEHFDNSPIDIELQVILGKPPKMLRNAERLVESHDALDLSDVTVSDAVERVLRLPAVADKTFLITIADRTVTGMTARDQMVGPYQVPISDVAVTTVSFKSRAASAMAMGERSALAVVSAPASGRMAVAEALTNICGAHIGHIGNVKLSANWMCACGAEGEDANLYDTVRAVGMEFCPAIGVCIPVGKDSLSMRTVWPAANGREEQMTAPLSLVISAFAPVTDAAKTVTADLKPVTDSQLVLFDIGRGRNRLGCSALARVYNQVGPDVPDAESPQDIVAFFNTVQRLVAEELLLAYHDRSDGGLIVTLAEMAFGRRTGIDVTIDPVGTDSLAVLFSEELGAVAQVRSSDLDRTMKIASECGAGEFAHVVGAPSNSGNLTISSGGDTIFRRSVRDLHRAWSELTCHMQAMRDNPECALEEYDSLLDGDDPGMTFHLSFDPEQPFNITGARPKVMILREQGVNGHVEMAAAFDAAGFESVDVHMTDLLSGRVSPADFAGLVACGGFSYGDVLGAGAGWAKSILYNERLKTTFSEFFARPDTFSLGVCNGCQMMSQLKGIIPGADDWPDFSRNKSEQFEARFVTVEVLPSPSILLQGMEGSRLGVPVAHGEGRADFSSTGSLDSILRNNLLSLRCVDNRGRPTEKYPLNPNGSPGGATGLTSRDGRATIMMPHPERVFRAVQLSYRPDCITGEAGPWLRMFQNARRFVDRVTATSCSAPESRPAGVPLSPAQSCTRPNG